MYSFYLLLCERCVYACVHWVPYGGGVYLLTIAIFASLASSVITSQRALQKKRRLPRNVSPGIHVKRCVRPGGHPSYPVEGRNLRDDDQKDFSNRQEGLIIYFKEKKTEHLETKLFKTTGPENVKKKGEKKYKERMMMKLMSLSWWGWCICSAGWRGRDVTTCVSHRPHISYRAILVQPEEGKFVWDDGDLHLLQSTIKKKKIRKEKKRK